MSELLTKIKKLLALADNTNFQGEAEAAYLQAQKLMVANGITLADVASEAEQGSKEVVYSPIAGVGKRRVPWKAILSSVVAENFRCEAFSRTVRPSGDVYLMFLGLKDDVEIAKGVYNSAAAAAEKFAAVYVGQMRREYGSLTSSESAVIKTSFCMGFVKGLYAKFKEQVEQNGWGLVLVVDPAVQEFKDNMNVTKNRESRSRYRHSGAIQSGYQAGYNFTPEGPAKPELGGSI